MITGLLWSGVWLEAWLLTCARFVVTCDLFWAEFTITCCLATGLGVLGRGFTGKDGETVSGDLCSSVEVHLLGIACVGPLEDLVLLIA